MSETSTSKDCLFCKIAAGTIPAPKLYEDEEFYCIKDIQPQAAKHLLVIPKAHIASLDTAFPAEGPQRTDLIGRLFETGTRIARSQGLLPGGFRAVINTNRNGGQTVFHVHLHLLGGEELREDFA
jgi:histidine triad (HIT) family protein